jgi:aldose 1-epimerase
MAQALMGSPERVLQAGRLRATVRPDLGGCLAGLWHAGLPVLRCTPPEALDSVRLSASYPLVPYSNRLAHCRFEWQGQTHHTQPNFPNSPHSLHGVGWLRAWTVVQAQADQVQLRYSHAPDADWPFAFEAEQHIRLTPDALHMTLSMRNTGAQAQPAGLGWHPYFVRREGAQLDIDLASRWDKDASELPLAETPVDGLHARVDTLDLDHCFAGWPGVARLRDPQMSLSLHSDLRWLVVFTPTGRDFYCVEPVSHRNDAIHSPEPQAQGLVSLAPGDTLRSQMRLQIEDRT